MSRDSRRTEICRSAGRVTVNILLSWLALSAPIGGVSAEQLPQLPLDVINPAAPGQPGAKAPKTHEFVSFLA
jgi:hypothetical protein